MTEINSKLGLLFSFVQSVVRQVFIQFFSRQLYSGKFFVCFLDDFLSVELILFKPKVIFFENQGKKHTIVLKYI